jgi:SAM-dependent methyltransferase
MVHEVAQRGFGREADIYERSRPSYPPDAVSWLAEQLGLRPGVTLADLAAGTGKLTRLLVPTRSHLVAIEPVPAMREVFRRVLPQVPVVAGTAEALPLRTSSLDAVTVAQAFHWFDAKSAFAELARVLRRGGGVGLVWNARDRSVDWVDRAWSIMDRVETEAPWRDHENWRDSTFEHSVGFAAVEHATFHHGQTCTPTEVIERFRGVSHVAALDPREQAEILGQVRELLATHPDTRGRRELRIPYLVDCFGLRRD